MFTALRYASSVYAMVLCLSIHLYVISFHRAR